MTPSKMGKLKSLHEHHHAADATAGGVDEHCSDRRCCRNKVDDAACSVLDVVGSSFSGVN